MKTLYTNINRNGRVTAAMITRIGAKRMCIQQSCIVIKCCMP
jgi:hypothetical protein